MQRGLVAIGVAALLCGLCYVALGSLVSSGMPVNEIVLLTCAVTLFLAAAATGFAARAMLRSNAVQADLARLSRSLDAAMRDLSARSNRDAATIGDLNTLVAKELESLGARVGTRSKSAVVELPAPRERSDNIVALPATRRAKAEPAETAAPPVAAQPQSTGFEPQIQRAYEAGRPELSLQPIVSISQGSAIGFEVYLHVEREDGMSLDLQKLPAPLPGLSQAAFERWMLIGAVDAARQQLGVAGEGLPLHVQISEALLSDSDELGFVLETLRKDDAGTRSVLLSMPAPLLERSGRFGEALDMLTETGVRIGAEGWSGTKEGIERLKRLGTVMVKFPAERLLGRMKLPRSAVAASRLVETAAALDMPLVAINVANDEDAVGLIDFGINLMTGNRFSGPRRLKTQAETRPSKAARF